VKRAKKQVKPEEQKEENDGEEYEINKWDKKETKKRTKEKGICNAG
jgi:hypothetical protein